MASVVSSSGSNIKRDESRTTAVTSSVYPPRNLYASQIGSVYNYGQAKSGYYGAGVSTTIGATRSVHETIIGERVVEREVRVPKRVVREDVIEKVVVVPEVVVSEEIVEETQIVREKIIEVAKPVYQEKIIEVPEIEYVERIVEVPQKVFREKIREVPSVQIQERIIEVPKIHTQEKIVEVPEIEYVEVPVEKVVEVPEFREEVIVREIPVPQYIDKPIAEYQTVQVPVTIERSIPVPVESVTTFEYQLPHIRPHYKKASFPVYVPRFVEVPVPEEMILSTIGEQATYLSQHVSALAGETAPSLCEIENIAADVKKLNLADHIASSDYHAAIRKAWTSGKVKILSEDLDRVPRSAPVYPPANRHTNYVPVVYQNPLNQQPTSHGESRRQHMY